MAKRKTNSVAGQLGTDPTLPDVVLRLGGKDRPLCFDFNAIVRVSKHTGINLLHAVVTEFEPEYIRALLWASLLKEDPELTLEQVGGLITMPALPVIQQAILTAWFASVSDEDAKPGEAPAQASSTTAA